MAVQNLQFNQSVTAVETPALGLGLAADVPIAHALTPYTSLLSPTTTPAVSKVASGVRTLTAGALTEDLTNLAGPSSTTVTFNTLKVVYVHITCPPTNTQPVVFTVGAANGYQIFGAAATKISVPAGGSFSLYLGAGGQTVGASAKTMDVTSVMSAAVYNIVMGAG